jgi:hypothetical protein
VWEDQNTIEFYFLIIQQNITLEINKSDYFFNIYFINKIQINSLFFLKSKQKVYKK